GRVGRGVGQMRGMWVGRGRWAIRSGTSARGMRTAPGTWPASYSSGWRTSRRNPPASRRSASSSTLISDTDTLLRLMAKVLRSVRVPQEVSVHGYVGHGEAVHGGRARPDAGEVGGGQFI